MPIPSDAAAAPDPALLAINLMIREGYDAITVDDLAAASGISRSTFFRRFGSKEDVVFADHDYILGKVAEFLRHSARDPLPAIADAALLVFRHHVEHRETSMARHRLLQQEPFLRDRELVSSHRYERLFRDHLTATVENPGEKTYRIVAAAAAVVAVHNAFLRQWFREPEADLLPTLERELHVLVKSLAPYFSGTPEKRTAPSVLVATLPPAASRAEILQAIEAALP